MPTSARIQHAEVVYPPKASATTYLFLTVSAALTAAVAAFAALSLGLPPWAMFMGWVAYYTRPTPSDGLQTFACVVVGLALGALASVMAGSLGPAFGSAALPIVVFGVACAVISTRGLPMFNNLLGYFIGLITFFAAHQPPALETIGSHAAAIGVGFAAGLISQRVQTLVAS
jgi:hypothetical protein